MIQLKKEKPCIWVPWPVNGHVQILTVVSLSPRVDGDDIVICDEVTAPSADDLKKAKKVSDNCMGGFESWHLNLIIQAAEPSSEEGVVCIE